MTVDQDGDLEAYPLQRQLFSNVRYTSYFAGMYDEIADE